MQKAYVKTLAGIAGLTLLSLAPDSSATHVQMFVYEDRNGTFSAEVGRVMFSVYDGAKLVEFTCDGRNCRRSEYALKERNGQFRTVGSKGRQVKPETVPGSRAALPSRLTLNCADKTTLAEGFRTIKEAREWAYHIYKGLEQSGELEGCPVQA